MPSQSRPRWPRRRCSWRIRCWPTCADRPGGGPRRAPTTLRMPTTAMRRQAPTTPTTVTAHRSPTPRADPAQQRQQPAGARSRSSRCPHRRGPRRRAGRWRATTFCPSRRRRCRPSTRCVSAWRWAASLTRRRSRPAMSLLDQQQLIRCRAGVGSRPAEVPTPQPPARPRAVRVAIRRPHRRGRAVGGGRRASLQGERAAPAAAAQPVGVVAAAPRDRCGLHQLRVRRRRREPRPSAGRGHVGAVPHSAAPHLRSHLGAVI